VAKLELDLTEAQFRSLLFPVMEALKQPWTPEEFTFGFAPYINFTPVEVVFIRGSKDNPEVLLAPRAHNDPHYPNQEHSLGSILRGPDALSTEKVIDLVLQALSGKCNHSIGTAEFYQFPIQRALIECGFSFEKVQENYLALFAYQPIQIGGFTLMTPRGPENALLIIAELAEEPEDGLKGKYWPVKEVLADPEFKLIHHQIAILGRALLVYQSELFEVLKNIPWW
jgi:hypothetical protein